MDEISVRRGWHPRMHPTWVVLPLVALTACLGVWNLAHLLPPDQWLASLLAADPDDVRQLLAHYAFYPRVALGLLGSGGLGLAGAIFQQVLRNPLADATTLGVTGGAYLAVSASRFWLPALAFGTELPAIVGGVSAAVLVFGFAWRQKLAPITLILCGLIVGLYCSTLSTAMILFHGGIRSPFIWGSGSLSVQSWEPIVHLAAGLAVPAALPLVLTRPLVLLGLSDDGAKSLGLSLPLMRLSALSLAVIMAALVASAVGPIGFVGLIAPALARLSGARTVRQRVVWSPLLGAFALCAVDQGVQSASQVWEIPAGPAVALLGAPLLLMLLPRLRSDRIQVWNGEAMPPSSVVATRTFICGAVIALILMAGISLSLGRGIAGWHWSNAQDVIGLFFWRGPRMLVAFCAGMMVACAGTIMQRMTGNSMASPEILGVSTGAALGVIAVLLLGLGTGRGWLAAGAASGASITLCALLFLSRKAAFSPDRMIYVGIALATLFSGLVSVLMASGDPRMANLFRWLSGSTWQAQPLDAEIGCAIILIAILLLPLMRRWLDILPLGAEQARVLGVDLGRSRLLLLLAAAGLTGSATLIIGPMSFIGVMAPHMARMFGQTRALPQLLGSALIGGLIMMMADWLGRVVLFPDQMPAGILASLIGGPYFLVLMRRRAA